VPVVPLVAVRARGTAREADDHETTTDLYEPSP
jgi:hypothetical protein